MADSDSRSGVRYADPEILNWLDRLHVPHDPALQAAWSAPERLDIPAIQVGRSEGKLLGMLLRLTGARKVVELGALAGYSGIHMARALPRDGFLWSLELEPAHAAVAAENLAAAGAEAITEVVVGPALETLLKIEHHGPFDAVFLDADKANYPLYMHWAARHLRPGGLLLGDNAYFFGNLLNEDDPAAACMRQFHLEARDHFDTVCIPTPDGLLLGIKR